MTLIEITSRTIATFALAIFTACAIRALRFRHYSQSWPGGGGTRLRRACKMAERNAATRKFAQFVGTLPKSDMFFPIRLLCCD